MLNASNVTKEYVSGDQKIQALRGVTLSISSGEFLSIAGPSGSGKTTLLNLMGCLDTPTSGTLEFSGQILSTQTKDQLATLRRDHLGFIFQSYNLIPVLSAWENVAFSLDILGLPQNEVNQRTQEALEAVGLKDQGGRLPGELSGGQQQRVAIARALVKRPALILADEPTANLDSNTGKDILNLMRALNQKWGTAFLFSTHDPMVMDFADRLILLHDGLITQDKRK